MIPFLAQPAKRQGIYCPLQQGTVWPEKELHFWRVLCYIEIKTSYLSFHLLALLHEATEHPFEIP